MTQKNPRRRFTQQEDEALKLLVQKYGAADWNRIANHMPSSRNARQCRHRYTNYLNESYKPSPWTEEEDELIVSMFHTVGPKWVLIAKSLAGRTGNDVKNRWHKHILRSLQMRASISPISSPYSKMQSFVPYSQYIAVMPVCGMYQQNMIFNESENDKRNQEKPQKAPIIDETITHNIQPKKMSSFLQCILN